MTTEKNYILDQRVAEKKIRRMALEIIENNPGPGTIILAGIRENGTILARFIQKLLTETSSVKTELIDISLDKRHPRDVSINKQIDFNDKVVIIIDDVANSGKTLLYALKPFLEYHPQKIQTMVLVERSHNNFPVRPDYIGLSIATTLQEQIIVETEGDRIFGAYLK